MKKMLKVLAAVSVAMFFAACGDDSSNNSSASENGMESCTVSKNADSTSYTLKCPDGTQVEIKDGKNGAAGKEGAAGKNADSTSNSGAGCTVKELEGGSVSLECPDGTKLVFGEDGKVAGKGAASSSAGAGSSVSQGGSSDSNSGSSNSATGNSSASVNPTGKTQGFVQFNRDVYTALTGAGIYLYDADNEASTATVTVYSDLLDTLLVTLTRYNGYFYGGLPVTTWGLNEKSLLVGAKSNIVAEYKDASTGVAKCDSAQMSLPDSLVSSPKISISLGKSVYYDTTDKAVILLKDYRLSDGFPVTAHVSSSVDDGRDIPLYPVNDGDGTERIGFVGFSVDEPGELAVKVEDGKTFGVSYGGKTMTLYANATWEMTELFGLDCTKDGVLQKGIKDVSKTYVCDVGGFRLAEELELTVGKGCTSYNRTEKVSNHICSKFWVSDSLEKKISTFTDTRDGRTYVAVQIGTQTWMAENLNYAVSNSDCYRDNASYCIKYGRLYTWSAAMDSAGTWSTNGKGCGNGKSCSPTLPVRGVCPRGWHLPDTTEWKTLFTTVGGESAAGMALKAQTGWIGSGNGSDAYSFSALPAGYREASGYHFDNCACFWSSTEGSNGSAYLTCISDIHTGSKVDEVSIRCLKD